MLKQLVTATLMTASLAHASTKAEPWGTTKAGQPVKLYNLRSIQLRVSMTDFDAHIVSIEAPDRKGVRADVVLGYNDLAGYEADEAVARMAFRTLSLNGTTLDISQSLLDHHYFRKHGSKATYGQASALTFA